MTNQINVDMITDFFLYKSQYDNDPDFTITPLKIQKLLYYSQAWNLAIHNIPLFEDQIEAWLHGPVIPSVYQKYKNYGYNQIRKEIADIPEPLKGNTVVLSLLEDIWKNYGKFDGKQLEKLTHSEEPWKNARKGINTNEASNTKIKIDDMRSYYRKY